METIKLSKQDSKAFVQALEQPVQHNERFMKAALRHKETVNQLDSVIEDENADPETRALCQLLKFSAEDFQEGRMMSSAELLNKLKQQRNLK